MIILNDKICKDNKIFLDSGYNFGYGVFETILVKKNPVMLEDHIERLNNSLRILNIDKEITKDYMLEKWRQIKASNCVLKISVSENNTLISTRDIPYNKEHYKKGFSLLINKRIKKNPFSNCTYLKTFNYMDNIIEKRKAKNQGFDEVLFLNTNNKICEGSISNIFFVNNHKIYTPALKCGLLNGVVRKWIIDNFKVIEGEYTIEDIINSQEVFITNSIIGIMKITKINEKVLSLNNPKTCEIQRYYDNYINICK